jgi:hypothetical protein
MANRGFSFGATLLSYFLVAGAIALSLIILAKSKLSGEPAFYGALALGGAVGGAFAARASRGSTILEPAIGGLLVIATLVGIFVGTEAGNVLWHVAKDEIVRTVAIAGACAAAGAILGAMLAERLPGGHSQGTPVWLLHVAFTTLGACFVATIVAVGFAFHGATDNDTLAGVFFAATGIGALLTGVVIGAAAPRRILFITFLGVVAGIMGFYLLIASLPTTDNKDAGKAALGFAIIGAGCGLLAMLGGAIGWRAVGRRAAVEAEQTSRAFA